MSESTSTAVATNTNGSAQEYPKPDAPEKKRTARQFITFSFYKLDPAWRHLSEEEKQPLRDAFIETVRDFQDSGTVVVPYSCVGMRADTDLLLWRIDYKLERLRDMSTQISQS